MNDLWSSPFTAGGRVLLVAASVLGGALCMTLLARRKLTMPYAIVWIGALAGFGLLVALPPLLHAASALLDTTHLEGAIRLLAMTLVFGFLLFFSVKISEVTHRLEELAQRVGLLEYALDEKIRRAASPTRAIDVAATAQDDAPTAPAAPGDDDGAGPGTPTRRA